MTAALLAAALVAALVVAVVLARAARPPVRVPPARPRRDVRAALDATGAEVDQTVYAAGGAWRSEDRER
jgi:hypothetical protein